MLWGAAARLRAPAAGGVLRAFPASIGPAQRPTCARTSCNHPAARPRPAPQLATAVSQAGTVTYMVGACSPLLACYICTRVALRAACCPHQCISTRREPRRPRTPPPPCVCLAQAPECFTAGGGTAGHKVSEKSDIYSLAVIMWEMLTGDDAAVMLTQRRGAALLRPPPGRVRCEPPAGRAARTNPRARRSTCLTGLSPTRCVPHTYIHHDCRPAAVGGVLPPDGDNLPGGAVRQEAAMAKVSAFHALVGRMRVSLHISVQ